MALTPEQELQKIKTENFAGGTYYGRTPGGIVDLTTGKIVQDTQNYGTTSLVNPINTSGIRRFIQPGGEDSYKSTTESLFGGLDTSPPTADEAGSIRNAEIEKIQRELDVTNEAYNSLIRREDIRGADRLGATRALSARSGVLGSVPGNVQKSKTEEVNAAAVAAIENERSLRLGQILSQARERGDALVEAETNKALKNADSLIAFRKQKQDEARADLKALGSAGISLQALNDNQYRSLLTQTGYEPLVFEAVYNANLPENDQQSYEYLNLGDGRVARVNKAGGTPEFFQFDAPNNFEFRMAGDIPIFVNPSTREVQVADVTGGSGVGAFGKETELDTYTNAEGKRVSVMYNPATKTTRAITHGAAGGDSGGGAYPTGFKPQSFEISAVNQFISAEGRKQGQTQEEIDQALQRIKTDPGFFYSLLSTVISDPTYQQSYYKPTTFGFPAGFNLTPTSQ